MYSLNMYQRELFRAIFLRTQDNPSGECSFAWDEMAKHLTEVIGEKLSGRQVHSMAIQLKDLGVIKGEFTFTHGLIFSPLVDIASVIRGDEAAGAHELSALQAVEASTEGADFFPTRPNNVPEHLEKQAEIKWEEACESINHEMTNVKELACQDAISRGLTNSSIYLGKVLEVNLERATKLARAFSEIFLPLWFEFDFGHLGEAEDCIKSSAAVLKDAYKAELTKWGKERKMSNVLPDFYTSLESDVPRRMLREFEKMRCHLMEEKRCNELQQGEEGEKPRTVAFQGDAPDDSVRILFLCANPDKNLDLAEEAREIEMKIRYSELRDRLTFTSKWAVRPDDLLQHLNEIRPHIVHFSGHGTQTKTAILLDKSGDAVEVTKDALVILFRTMKDNIRVVVLNSCFSEAQAKAIAKYIDCVVGMSKDVDDEAARVFAGSFYRAIGFGKSLQNAFDQGRTSLSLHNFDKDVPQLFVRDGMDACDVVLVQNSTQVASSASTKKANLTACIIEQRKDQFRLVIENRGDSEARNIRLRMDGKPFADHEAAVQGDTEIGIIGANSRATYLLGLHLSCTPPFKCELLWDDDSREQGYYRTMLTL